MSTYEDDRDDQNRFLDEQVEAEQAKAARQAERDARAELEALRDRARAVGVRRSVIARM